MCRCAAITFLLFVGVVFHQSHGIEVNVTDKDQVCLYAKLMLDFTVSYEGANKTILRNSFKIPENATTAGSKCYNDNSTLKLNFGAGHSWSINFIKNEKSYQADLITFTYNLSDTNYFPDASSNKTTTVSQNASITVVELNTCYSCKSSEMISADQVNMTLSDVLIQAFVFNGNVSENVTSCAADKPSTPAPATTTAAPVTTAPTPTTPTTPLPTPQTGNYSVGPNTSFCMLANFGLRIGFRLNQTYHEMNFEPVGATVSGNCGFDSSELMLVSEEMIVTFTFFNDTKKFHLHTLNVTVIGGFGFSEMKTNLSLWETNIGSSYMCNKEQNSTITDKLSLYTFNLRVQPFGVQNGVFSTAEECFLDSDLSFLVPIAVGVALSFLIILVLISYLIGRRKSRTGYQSV